MRTENRQPRELSRLRHRGEAFHALLWMALLGVAARVEAQAPTQEPARGVAPEGLLAIRAGRIITLAGEDIIDGTILIEGGRILAIGRDVEVPWNARVFRHEQGVVLPGLIACHSTIGLRIPNEVMADVPFISVTDGLDPSSAGIKSALRDGITVAHVLPDNVTRIGGQGAVIRCLGRSVDELVIVAPSAIKISLQPSRGETRMQNMASLRKSFFDAFLAAQRALRDAAPPMALDGPPTASPSLADVIALRAPWDQIDWAKLPRDKLDGRMLPMLDMAEGKLPVMLYVGSPSDVFKAFELMDSNRLRATLVLSRDGYKAVDALKARKDLGPVVLDDDLVTWEEDPDSGALERFVTPRILYDAGIRFALDVAESQGSSFAREGETHLWYQAAQLVRFGLSRDEALRCITETPAKILRLEKRMGTLEPGKDANLAIFTGDPLDARSWVDRVIIEGRVAYDRKSDRDLELLLREPEASF